MDKNYKDTMDKFFKDYANNEYDDIVEMGEAILRELQRCLGTQGKFHKRTENGHEEVNNEAALQICNVSCQTDSIIVDFLKKKNSFGWKFRRICGQVEDTWVAVKVGFTYSNAKEGETMLTGVRKIANWAFLEGHFREYANAEIGRTTLERKGLSVENYKILFDQKSDERSGAVSHHSAGSNSPSRENEDVQLRGEALSEYMRFYTDIVMKQTPESDINSKKFYRMLQKCLETKMVNNQQWNSKKTIFNHYLQRFEDGVKGAAAICQRAGTTFFKDKIIPALIEEAKEKLLGA
eukprot:scaffold222481_cov36-Cyclotella_meneghiniana.AAC.2